MAEELQHLIERIQREGMDKAKEEAGRIIAAAQEKAAAIVREAEAQAAERVRRAERDEQTFVERGRKTLEQTARDVMLEVNQAVSDTLRALVTAEVGAMLTPDVVRELAVKVVEASCAREGDYRETELLVNPADREQIQNYFLQRFRVAMEKGLEIRGESGLAAGFRVSSKADHVHHDFTGKEIAEAFCRLLRPRLAAIVKAAAG